MAAFNSKVIYCRGAFFRQRLSVAHNPALVGGQSDISCDSEQIALRVNKSTGETILLGTRLKLFRGSGLCRTASYTRNINGLTGRVNTYFGKLLNLIFHKQ